MTHPLLTAKAALIFTGTIAAVVTAMDPTVKVALISAVASVISSSIWGWANHNKIAGVEKKADGMMSAMKQERDAATTRADISEGKATGRADARVEAIEDKKSDPPANPRS
jgi:hypothetical protein